MDDNTYECPNCGATIYPEMTRCPQCGHSMYPEDDDRVLAEAVPTAPAWISFLGALLIGWIIACGDRPDCSLRYGRFRQSISRWGAGEKLSCSSLDPWEHWWVRL